MNYGGARLSILKGGDKLFKYLTIVVLFMSIFPFAGVVSAYDGGLLHGKPMYRGDTRTNETVLTDGDFSTGVNMYFVKDISYTFDKPVDITHYQLGTGYTANLYLGFYDKDGKLIKSIAYPALEKGVKTMLEVKGVYKVSVTCNASDSRVLYEFDVWGKVVSENPDASKFVVEGLDKTFESGSLKLSWLPIDSDYFKKFNVYKDGVLAGSVTSNSYSFVGLDTGKTYSFKVVPLDVFGDEYAGALLTYTVPLPDTTPPAIPTNLNVVPDRYTAQVSWTAPLDDDVAGYFIYLNGTLLNATPTSATNFNVTSLKLESEYTVAVAAVDTSGNLSPKTAAKAFKTLSLKTEPPVPMSLTAAAYNGAAALTWAPVQSAGSYKVYQDGVNVMDVTSASVRVKSLQNGRQYKFAVSAVNEVGESKKSNEVAVTPSVKSVPDVSIGNGVTGVLTPISQSTGYWFENLWKLLAFTIGIPLAFYIGNRMKGLFIA